MRWIYNGPFKAKVIYDKEWEEWQVLFYSNDIFLTEATYHTDDKDDAIITAQAEIDHMVKNHQQEN